eukprot:GFUD01006384.1.p1 GENE.GFUD01006384.1~~GFUD01006384.1.p1  ORF type:complete len:118 (+),score=27.63 GFUD01006384.1:436-789(+)
MSLYPTSPQYFLLAMVQGENSGSRRRNKRRGKGRSQTTQSARAVNGHDRSGSSSSTSPAGHQAPGSSPGQGGRSDLAMATDRTREAFLANLVKDLSPYTYSMARLQDAEVKFYSRKV